MYFHNKERGGKVTVMKTVIVGAGALGSLFAYFFARSDKEVFIVDKYAQRADFINKNGIQVEGVSGEHTVYLQAFDDPKKAGKADLALICVKAPDTASAAETALPMLGPASVVLTVQNGLGNVERIASVVGEERVLGGTTAHGATLLDSGHVRHAGEGETIIGEISGKITPRLEKIRDYIASCGIAVSVTENLESLIWSKLVVNVGINALTALTRMKNGEMALHEGTRKVMAAAVAEAVAVIDKKGIKLLYDDPVAKVESVCRATAGNISSMLQDVLKQKPTEVAYINGAIVTEAKKLGIGAPINEALENLVDAIQEDYPKQILK